MEDEAQPDAAPAQAYRIEFRVAVEPETDLAYFQPGTWCAMLVGTDWKWVGGSPEEAAYALMRWALRGGYRDQDWPPEVPFTLIREDLKPKEG